MCDNWTYTLYFWNEKVGIYDERNFISIDKETKTRLVQVTRRVFPETYMSNDKVPVLFSEATSWEPRPFMTMLDFLDTL